MSITPDNNISISTSTYAENDINELKNYSRFLTKIAWLIEIIVVFIGLCISVSFMTSTTSDNLSALILSAPFVMISLVELSKIPFVKGLWYSRKSFVLYVPMVLILCLITFETLLNGFERSFSSINNEINLREIEISKIESVIQRNSEDISIRMNDYTNKAQKIDNNKKKVNTTYQTEYARKSRENNILLEDLPELKTTLRTQKMELNTLKMEKLALLQEFSMKKEERLKNSMARHQQGIDLVQVERERLLAQIGQLTKDKKIALDEASFLTSDSQRKYYDNKIRFVEEQMNNINNNTIIDTVESPELESVKFLDDYYADLLALKDDMIKQKSEEVDSISQEYENSLNELENRYNLKKQQLFNNKKTALTVLNNKQEKIDNDFSIDKDYINTIKKENVKLRFDIKVLEIETNTVALSNQVYRVASYIDNVESYKQVKKETLTLVGLIWFGSLAFIGAITGIALSLSGLHLKGLARKREQKLLTKLT